MPILIRDVTKWCGFMTRDHETKIFRLHIEATISINLDGASNFISWACVCISNDIKIHDKVLNSYWDEYAWEMVCCIKLLLLSSILILLILLGGFLASVANSSYLIRILISTSSESLSILLLLLCFRTSLLFG